ncbi:MAG: hypothetical protein HKL80_03385 [Acidimicrobiales bacterium]|nr:hypothetical protein [Acidimicrobiales bacterium]
MKESNSGSPKKPNKWSGSLTRKGAAEVGRQNRPFKDRDGSDQRDDRPYRSREGGTPWRGEKRSFNDRDRSEQRDDRPYRSREGGTPWRGEDKPRGDRDRSGQGEGRPFRSRDGGAPYRSREGGAPYRSRDGGAPYRSREGGTPWRGEDKPRGDRDRSSQGERRPFRERSDGPPWRSQDSQRGRSYSGEDRKPWRSESGEPRRFSENRERSGGGSRGYGGSRDSRDRDFGSRGAPFRSDRDRSSSRYSNDERPRRDGSSGEWREKRQSFSDSRSSGPRGQGGSPKPFKTAQEKGLLGGIVIGKRSVAELIKKNSRKIYEILVAHDYTEGHDDSEDIESIIAQSGVTTRSVSKRELDDIAGTYSHQGVVAKCRPIDSITLDQLLEILSGSKVSVDEKASVDSSEVEDFDSESDVEELDDELLAQDDEDDAFDEVFEAESITDEISANEEIAEEVIEVELTDIELLDQEDLDEKVSEPAIEPANIVGAPIILVLDGITDPQNLGAILRSAACSGVKGVVLPAQRSAKLTPAVTKVAAGGVEYISFVEVGGIPAALMELASKGVEIIGLDSSGDTSIFELPVHDGLRALVVGSEGSGLSRLTKIRCDLLANIPHGGGPESLNVSVATGIALFELCKSYLG